MKPKPKITTNFRTSGLPDFRSSHTKSEIENPKSEIRSTPNTIYQQIALSTCGTEVRMLAKLYHSLRPYLNSQQAKN